MNINEVLHMVRTSCFVGLGCSNKLTQVSSWIENKKYLVISNDEIYWTEQWLDWEYTILVVRNHHVSESHSWRVTKFNIFIFSLMAGKKQFCSLSFFSATISAWSKPCNAIFSILILANISQRWASIKVSLKFKNIRARVWCISDKEINT